MCHLTAKQMQASDPINWITEINVIFCSLNITYQDTAKRRHYNCILLSIKMDQNMKVTHTLK